MSNKLLIFFSLIIVINLLFIASISYGKSASEGTKSDCGGSGKKSQTIKYCCYYTPPYCSSYCNCDMRYDPAFPFFEYEPSATKYSIQNFMPAILISFFLTFFFIALIPKSRSFILKIFSKIFQIKPKIIQTKCKYYNSYWLRKFKKYL